LTEDTLKAALEALTATTKAGRLRELMPTIESKVAAGVRHEDILEALNAHGFDLTERTYKTYLYRFRKAIKSSNKPPSSPSMSPAAAVQSSPAEDRLPGETKGVAETEPNDSVVPASSRAELEKVMQGTPNLDQLAKAFTKGRKK
jgi:hypothetical protein